MSELTEQLNNGQQANFKRDTAKIFLWNNRYQKEEYTNGTGAEVTLKAGTLMGRVHASGEIVPLTSTPAVGSEGSQFPVGILNQDVTVANGVTVDVYICVAGDVAEEKVILSGTDTLETVIADRRLRDRIAADTHGIKLVVSDELTAFDNE